MLGIDSDNGSEFINDELLRYANQEHLTFTRSRPGRKNDGAHVEQKNWSVVRRYVGDLRYDTPEQVALLNQLYEVLHLYINFFLPVVKLKEKVRHGNKVTKKYDVPQTPYQRVWRVPRSPSKIKAKLRAQQAQLDLVALHPQIERLVKQLWTSGRRRRVPHGPGAESWPSGAHLRRHHVASPGVQPAPAISVTCFREATNFYRVSFIHEETNQFR